MKSKSGVWCVCHVSLTLLERVLHSESLKWGCAADLVCKKCYEGMEGERLHPKL